MPTTTPGGIFVAHADHGLGLQHLVVIDEVLHGWDGKGVAIRFVTLPPGCPDALSALYGPCAGDPPIYDGDEDVYWEIRGNRKNPSKLVERPHRPVRGLVVIAGPGRKEPIVYTAYGSPLVAPMEPTDPNLSDRDRAWAQGFWSVHALAK